MGEPIASEGAADSGGRQVLATQGFSDVARRVLGYGIAAVVIAAAIWGAAYRGEPDVGMQLETARFQLQIAYALPAEDQDGNRLSERDRMLDSVEKSLESAERRVPGLTATAELRAFLLQMRGDDRAAADAYRTIRTGMEVGPEQLAVVLFQEARLRRGLGELEAALDVLASAREPLSKDLQDRAKVMRASILFELGRKDAARSEVACLVDAAAERPMPSVWAGGVLLAGGEQDAAEAAFLAAVDTPDGVFQLARLKLEQGQVDTAVELLAHARAGFSDRIQVLLKKDRDHWVELAGAERLEQLLNSSGEPASPGR